MAASTRAIVVTTAINLPASGGRKEFVYQINPPSTHNWYSSNLVTDTLVTGLSKAGDLRRNLKTHIGERSYKCNKCDFASTKAGDFRRHLKTHSGEKSSKCNLLRQGPRLIWVGEPDKTNFASSHAGNLRIYFKTHSGEKSSKCTQCNFAST